jgi:predicted nucleotidyltransferase
METGNSKLFEIKAIIRHLFPDAEIVLFGSRARGEELLDSDYDILIILKQYFDNQHRLQFQAQIRKALANQNILADIIIQSIFEIEKKKLLPGHIVKTALLEGIRV